MRTTTIIRRGRNGFTLLELLTTIGVLLILSSILFPVLSRAKAKTHETRCTHNLHQHALALQSFLADQHEYPLSLNPAANAGVEPDHGRSFFSALIKNGLGPIEQTENNVHTCPAAFRQTVPRTSDTRSHFGYGYNMHGLGRRLSPQPQGLGGMAILGQYYITPVHESSVLNPSEMITIGDGVRGWNNTFDDSVAIISRSPEAAEWAGSNTRVPQRHRQKLVILLADGHVQPLTLTLLFTDTSTLALRLWNRDNLPPPERLQ